MEVDRHDPLIMYLIYTPCAENALWPYGT